MKAFAVINQKGGVGKTTTVANLGAILASRGHSILLIDLDPQAHLTMHFGLEPADAAGSSYDVLTEQASLAECSVRVADGLQVVPSVIDLAAAEVELVTKVGREQILREALASDAPECEFVLIDCPPSLGLLTLNALAAADEVLIPLQPHFLALQGMGKLLESVSLVQQRINPRLRVTGVVFCMYETSTRLAGEVAADLENFLESSRDSQRPWARARIFSSRIRRNIKLAECPSHGQTIIQYDPNSIGAEDYLAFAEEFLATVGAQARQDPARQAAGQDSPARDESPSSADRADWAGGCQQSPPSQVPPQDRSQQPPGDPTAARDETFAPDGLKRQ